MDVLGAACRTGDVSFFVLSERENCFEGLLAIFTKEFVARHRHLPRTCDRILRPPGSPRSSVTEAQPHFILAKAGESHPTKKPPEVEGFYSTTLESSVLRYIFALFGLLLFARLRRLLP